MNALRAHMAELGIVAETGLEGLAQLVNIVAEARSSQLLPRAMVQALSALIDQIMSLNQHIRQLDLCIKEQHRASDVSKRLESIPGIGVIGATALAATVTDPSQFKSGRDLAAWIGLVPKQNSTGGKIKLGSITKQGDQYLRRLLVIGGTSIVKMAKTGEGRCRCSCEQTGTHRLGNHEQRRNLSNSKLCGEDVIWLGNPPLR